MIEQFAHHGVIRGSAVADLSLSFVVFFFVYSSWMGLLVSFYAVAFWGTNGNELPSSYLVLCRVICFGRMENHVLSRFIFSYNNLNKYKMVANYM